jgi:hypothetical protein
MYTYIYMCVCVCVDCTSRKDAHIPQCCTNSRKCMRMVVIFICMYIYVCVCVCVCVCGLCIKEGCKYSTVLLALKKVCKNSCDMYIHCGIFPPFLDAQPTHCWNIERGGESVLALFITFNHNI